MVAGTMLFDGIIQHEAVVWIERCRIHRLAEYDLDCSVVGNVAWPIGRDRRRRTSGGTRSVPVPVVNDCDVKLDCALPVMSTTPVTLMV